MSIVMLQFATIKLENGFDIFHMECVIFEFFVLQILSLRISNVRNFETEVL